MGLFFANAKTRMSLEREMLNPFARQWQHYVFAPFTSLVAPLRQSQALLLGLRITNFYFDSDDFETKYIIPVITFAKQYIFSSCQIRYELGSSEDCDIAQVIIWTSEDDWVSQKALMGLLLVPPGTVCWSDFLFDFEGGRSNTFQCPKNFALLQKARSMWNGGSVKYVVMSDEHSACIFYKFSHRSGRSIFIGFDHMKLSKKMSLRCVIGAVLNTVAPQSYRPEAVESSYEGALNNTFNAADSPIAVNSHPAQFSDFDMFTMQRHLPDALAFLDWHLWGLA
ncbi:hypothetical protein VNI00_016304 [Paramarasmius palmivorus]|uniref:Uncharacterized protein n=1 Tax=Paramarasmius palmivorus TaxID=297713 RepID=A0AAW0BE84_9AGAR